MKGTPFPSDLWINLVQGGQSEIILDSLPAGLGIYAPDGDALYLNHTILHMIGADRDDYTVQSLNLFDNPNLPEEVRNAVRNGSEIRHRFLYQFKEWSGANTLCEIPEPIHIECQGRPISDPAGSYAKYVFIVQDISEAVHNEEKLAQSRRKTELAICDSQIMLWEFDVCKKLFYSDNEPLNGYDRSRPISVEVYTGNFHPDDQNTIRAITDRLLAGEDFSFTIDARILFPGNPEWQYCRVTGAPYEYDSEGCVIRYVGTRKNNTKLQKRKVLQDNILNSIPLPIHIKDIQNDFHYVFCNEESKRMFGTSEDKTTYDVMTAEQVARIEKTDKEVFATGKPYLGLERIELKDGRVYDTIVRKSIFYDNGKRLLLNVRWDQSLQNELERRAKVLSISMKAVNAYAWFYEPEKDCVSFGEGFERAGRNTTHLNSLKKFTDCIHPDERQLFIDIINNLVTEENGDWELEYRVDLDGSGVYEWWQTYGIMETELRDDVPYKYMFGFSISIEAHKQTELTLLRNKDELNSLIRQNELVLNNTNSGLAYITTDYIVQWENISMCSASLSYEAYKRGEPCYKSAHGRNTPCRNCVMQRAISSRQTESIKFPLTNNHTIEVFATPVFRDYGEIDGVVIRVDDITEREQMIRKMEHARTLAEQSDKLKSAFLANMSHEIRTPLNAIVGFSELLATAADDEEKEEYIRIINSNNELLLKLINDILDLSKIEAGSVELKYEDFDLSEYFEGMAASMKQRVGNPNVRLIAINPYPVCNVRLDKNRIAQIITNYVTNAIKYAPKGFIEMTYQTTDAGIRFCVRDSGIGIPDEKKDKVFHRFEKLDEFAQGTGLGLSICKAIAESMGGSVGFESHHGEGSLFWAFLPCAPETSEKASAQKNPQEGLPDDTQAKGTTASGGKTVLIAEDIPSNYLLVSAMLKDKYNLIHALNGQQAVEMAKTCNPDLVLMDMKMPVMDGLTATAEIRKFDTELPIIALTAHAFDADRQVALAAGCNEYLVKPIDKAKLMSVLRKYCSNPGK